MNRKPSHTNLIKSAAAGATLLVAAVAAPSHAGEWSANAAMTNNYIWRGLTQTENEAAIQGGIDYSHESGFYAGTWVSNVNYGPSDVYSYEHDMYAGLCLRNRCDKLGRGLPILQLRQGSEL